MSETTNEPSYEELLARYHLDQEHAKRAHDLNRQSSFEYQKAAVESANLAMRSLILVNGGAVIALLAFVGGIESGENSNTVASAKLVTPIFAFAIGTGLAMVTAALAYLVNMLDADINNSVELVWQHPYVVEESKAGKLRFCRIALHYIAILLSFGSLVSFFVGVWRVSSAIMALSL